MNNEGAAEKLLLSKIMKNHKKSKDQQLRASSLRRNQAADRATVSLLGALVSEADLKIPGNWIWPKPQGLCPPCHIDGRGNNADETKLDDDNDDNDDGRETGAVIDGRQHET